jgi:hypothetical protein
MANTNDLTGYRLQKRIADLEAENARYQKNQNLARKYEFRITGAILLAIGAVVTVIAYPSYNLSSNANVLMMVGIGALFVGAVTMFLNTETFINQKVAEDLNLSSVVVVDDLLRDLRVKHKGIYLPPSETGGEIKVFIPLRRDYVIPRRVDLADDKAFLIGLPNAAQEGVLLKPLGYHLYRYTLDDLKADWSEAASRVADEAESESETAHEERPALIEQLQDVLVKGLEIADKVTVSLSDDGLRVRLHNSAYSGMCQSMAEQAPQVCEQIGCPLCSMIACIYTEYTGTETTIEEAQNDERDITVLYKSLARTV